MDGDIVAEIDEFDLDIRVTSQREVSPEEAPGAVSQNVDTCPVSPCNSCISCETCPRAGCATQECDTFRWCE